MNVKAYFSKIGAEFDLVVRKLGVVFICHLITLSAVVSIATTLLLKIHGIV